MARLEDLKGTRERLEDLFYRTNKLLESFEKVLTEYREMQGAVAMDLNRARRLEREELQNGKQQSYKGY